MQNFIFLRINGDNWKVNYNDIQYIEAVDKYVKIFTVDSKKVYLLLFSMCQVEKLLPAGKFCRIHRSYIVSVQHITHFNNEICCITDKELPVGKFYKGSLEDKVTIWGVNTRNKLSGNNVDRLLETL
ncbi:MAG: LytTR family DNA-binding domain-containing protein [Bacteroidota bacterium]